MTDIGDTIAILEQAVKDLEKASTHLGYAAGLLEEAAAENDEIIANLEEIDTTVQGMVRQSRRNAPPTCVNSPRNH